MARDISEIEEVQVETEITFDKRRISGSIIRKHGGVTQIVADIEIESTATGVKKNKVANITIGDTENNVPLLTVQNVIDDLETFAGSAPDLSTLSVVDFINSIIHERLNE